jgi:septum site-determining protein MinC
MDEMRARLDTKASFFVGGRVALRVGDRPLSAEQVQAIGTVLEEFGVTLWAVEGTHPTTHAATQELGLETSLRPAAPAATVPERSPLEDMAGVVVRQTLRSGQVVRHAGHVTLLGDVNPGAEVVAGGHVVVWGSLRGTVHAGAMGDDGAVICALQLAPSQIRIAGHIARSPERGRPPTVPEIAMIHEGSIVVERWNVGKISRLRIGDWALGTEDWSRRLKALFGLR